MRSTSHIATSGPQVTLWAEDLSDVEAERQELPGPDGLLAQKERKPGYTVFTAEDLKAKGYPGSAGGDIYAIFEVAPDPVFDGQKWDGRKLQEVMTAFESRRKYRTMKALKFLSALPRGLSLQELLKAMV